MDVVNHMSLSLSSPEADPETRSFIWEVIPGDADGE